MRPPLNREKIATLALAQVSNVVFISISYIKIHILIFLSFLDRRWIFNCALCQASSSSTAFNSQQHRQKVFHLGANKARQWTLNAISLPLMLLAKSPVQRVKEGQNMAQNCPRWAIFWPYLTPPPPADPVEFLWFKMGVPHIVLHVLCSTRTSGECFRFHSQFWQKKVILGQSGLSELYT